MRSDNDLHRMLEDVAEALDSGVAPVTRGEVTERVVEPRSRKRHRILTTAVVVAAVMVVAAVVGLVNRGGDESDGLNTAGQPGSTEPESLLDARELDDAQTSVVGDELWVFGGLSGPEGSQHPSPSSIPDGWEVNETIVMYDIDGRLAFHALLPGWNGSQVGGDVIADGVHRYLVTSACTDTNCGTGFQPVVYRLTDNRAVPVPVRFSDESAFAFDRSIEVIATSGDGVVWATQKRSGAGVQMLQTGRILAIDLRGGVVTEIPLPESTSVVGPTCVADGRVFAAFPPGLDPSPFTGGFRVLHRPATVTEAEWVTAVDPDLLDDISSVTNVHCSPAGSLTVMGSSAGPDPRRSLTISVDDQSGADPTSTPVPRDSEVLLVGDVGRQAVYLGWESSTEKSSLYLHTSDGGWVAAVQDLPPDIRPVVLSGEVRDAADATSRIDPDGIDMPVIEITDRGS